MNFTFTWILDKFGFVPKFEKVDFQEYPFPVKPAIKKTAAKKTTKSVKIPKATTRKTTKK